MLFGVLRAVWSGPPCGASAHAACYPTVVAPPLLLLLGSHGLAPVAVAQFVDDRVNELPVRVRFVAPVANEHGVHIRVVPGQPGLPGERPDDVDGPVEHIAEAGDVRGPDGLGRPLEQAPGVLTVQRKIWLPVDREGQAKVRGLRDGIPAVRCLEEKEPVLPVPLVPSVRVPGRTRRHEGLRRRSQSTRLGAGRRPPHGEQRACELAPGRHRCGPGRRRRGGRPQLSEALDVAVE